MTRLNEDVSVLTNVSTKTLDKFINISTACIGHAVHESCCEKSNISIIDIGIRELHIKIDDCEIRYKFVPSKELEKTLIQTVTTKNSPIISKLNENLQEKIDKTYKELI